MGRRASSPRQASGRLGLSWPFTLPGGSVPRADVMLHRSVYAYIRGAIQSGQMLPGARLPSTRQMAADLKVSRNTVILAFELLVAEGYVESAVGSGSFVAHRLPAQARGKQPCGTSETPPPLHQPELGRHGKRLAAMATLPPHQPANAFAPGRTDRGLFPFNLWSRLQQRCWRNPGADLLDDRDPRGHLGLRRAISIHLHATRGIRCEPDQVIVTSGAQQGHDLVARTLLDPGDQAWCEEPGYEFSRMALSAAGMAVIPIPVDEAGLSVAYGRTAAPMARLASVVPSHQYPTGAVMTLARRLELLEWASQANAWVVEDDYGSEFRHAGRALRSLQAIDREQRVIHIGSFSTVLLPSMRLGYVVVPGHLADVFTKARALVDQHPPIWLQPVLARFIGEGHLASHLRRLRCLYDGRRQSFLAARHHLDGVLDVPCDELGPHMVGEFHAGSRERLDDAAAVAKAARAGLHLRALSSFYAGAPRRQGLVLGYMCVEEAVMEARVRELAAALTDPS